MAPTIYVVRVIDHPEFPVENMVGESALSVAQVYVQGYNVPVELSDDMRIYDCYTATMYVLNKP